MGNIVCIGSGNMGVALMKGAVGGGAVNGSSIYFTDADEKKAISSAASLKANVIKTNKEAAIKGDYIFFAVKPQVLQTVLDEIAPVARRRLEQGNSPVFISMAAGWSIEKIQKALGMKLQGSHKPPVVRMMPNTPALIGKGMIVYSASPEVDEKKITELKTMLSGAGVVDQIEEKFLDAVTGVSGSGPAFAYLFIDALAEGGARAGLPKNKALSYAAQTVLGASLMLQQTGKMPQDLISMVTSPGGTTLAGLGALKENAFYDTVVKSVMAAYKRAGELGQG